jgi:hypothetical protein
MTKKIAMIKIKPLIEWEARILIKEIKVLTIGKKQHFR